MSVFLKDCRRLRSVAVAAVSRIHTSRVLNFPRGAPKSLTSIELITSSEGSERKWEAFVNEKRQKYAPLAHEVRTVFGTVRFDDNNKIEYHGQLEDLEKEEQEKSFTENDEFREVETPAARSSDSFNSVDEIESGDHLFFEDPSQLRDFSLARSKAQSRDERKTEKTMPDSVKEYLNEIDEQYFGTLKGKRPDDVLASTESVKTSSSASFQNEELTNFFDQQFFATPETQTRDISAKVSTGNVSLSDPSLSDLNYIDQQLIFGDDKARTLAAEEIDEQFTKNIQNMDQSGQGGLQRKSSEKQENRIDPESCESAARNVKKSNIFQSMKQSDSAEKEAPGLKRPKKTIKAVESHDRPDVEVFPKYPKKQRVMNARKGSALEYVRMLRRGALNNPSPMPAKTREEEVSEIGVSLQARVAASAASSNLGLLKYKSSSSLAVETSNDDGDNDFGKGSSFAGRVQPKFLPQDFSKLTSVEVVDILKKSVLFDAHDIVGIYKPYGIPMFGESRGNHHSLEKYLPALCSQLETEKLFEVHRLDKSTTGVILYAKTQAMHAKLVRLFKERKIEKHYWAILNGTPNPAEGIINIPLSDGTEKTRYRAELRPDVRGGGHIKGSNTLFPAVTDYTTLKTKGNASLVEVKPVTGYRHQIRAHLGLGLGTPILGDHKYSFRDAVGRPQKIHGDILQRLNVRFGQSRNLPIYLHARKVLIPEIVEGKELWITARLPHFFNKTMKKLGLTPNTKLD